MPNQTNKKVPSTEVLLRMFQVEGLFPIEISRKLEIPPQTVRRYLRKAGIGFTGRKTKIKIEAGTKRGRWTVVDPYYTRNSFGTIYSLCRCVCGTIKTVANGELKKGSTKSCGCYRDELSSSRNRKRPFEHLFGRLLASAKKRSLPCSLTYEEYLSFVNHPCHYCGIDILWNPHSKDVDSDSYHVDRKNNLEGYTLENGVPTCKRCNYGKGSEFTYEEWVEIGKTIKAFRERANG